MNLYRVKWPAHTHFQHMIVADSGEDALAQAKLLGKHVPVLQGQKIDEIVMEQRCVYTVNSEALHDLLKAYRDFFVFCASSGGIAVNRELDPETRKVADESYKGYITTVSEAEQKAGDFLDHLR